MITLVNAIPDMLSDVLDIDPECEYTGGERGWVRDVLRVRLSIEKLSALGWKPEVQSQSPLNELPKN